MSYQKTWDPHNFFLFGLISKCCFHHSNSKILSESDENWKHQIGVFKSWKLSFSGIMVNIVTLWDPWSNTQDHFFFFIFPLHRTNISSLPLLFSLFSFLSFFSSSSWVLSNASLFLIYLFIFLLHDCFFFFFFFFFFMQWWQRW